MSGTVSNRQIRRTVNIQAGYVEQHHEILQKIIQDELKTRGRVDALDELIEQVGRVAGEAHAMATPRRTLLGRLSWFLRGY